MAHRTTFTVDTRGRGTCDITARVAAALDGAPALDGVAHVFCHQGVDPKLTCTSREFR
ncbi:MAG: hypothetical protein HS111_11740 [Kofleriaceae bacterium]|nr:hypothetical protein [Kofleriaceae bacterium]